MVVAFAPRDVCLRSVSGGGKRGAVSESLDGKSEQGPAHSFEAFLAPATVGTLSSVSTMSLCERCETM